MEPLASAERLSQYTGGKIAESHPGAVELLRGASAAIRRRCGWHISPPVTEELVVDSIGGELLQLPTLHVTEVFTVTEHRRDPIPGDDVEWSETGTLRRAYGRWPNRFRGVRALVTHGYPVDEVDDLAQVVCQAVASALSSPMGATREQAGALAVSWATTAPGVSGGLSLLQRDLDLVDSYMREGAA